MLENVDVFELARVLLKRWWVIFLCMVIAGTGTYLYSRFIQEKQYVSVGRLYIDTYSDNKSGATDETGADTTQRDLSAINASQKSVLTCIEVLKSTRVLSRVAEESALEYSASRIRNMTSMSSANGTEVLEIRVTSSKYQETKLLVDTIMAVGKEELKEIVGIANITVVDEGTTAKKEAPVSPNIQLETIVGTLIGVMVGALIVIAIALLDKRIKSEEDLQKYKVPVIGVIPEIF